MSNIVQLKKDVRSLINSETFKTEIAKVLPKHLTPERMTRVALTAFLKTPKLLQCTPESLTNALLICSQVGLEPDGRLAHLIPYGDTVQVIFDYKGLLALAIRNGMEAVYADTVREEDDFQPAVVDGKKSIVHRINYRKARGEAYAYYAVCQRNGIIDFEVMTKDEIDAIRERSRAKASGPWVTDYDEMAKKTVLRRLSKRWDLLPEIRDAIYEDDDTPDLRPNLAVSKPLFEIAKPEQPVIEAGEAGGEPAGVSPEPENAPTAVQTPKQPTPASDKGGSFNYVRAVRNLCKMEKLSEGTLLDYLSANGSTDGSVTSLEELATYDGGKVLVMVHDAWKTVVEKMKEAK